MAITQSHSVPEASLYNILVLWYFRVNQFGLGLLLVHSCCYLFRGKTSWAIPRRLILISNHNVEVTLRQEEAEQVDLLIFVLNNKNTLGVFVLFFELLFYANSMLPICVPYAFLVWHASDGTMRNSSQEPDHFRTYTCINCLCFGHSDNEELLTFIDYGLCPGSWHACLIEPSHKPCKVSDFVIVSILQKGCKLGARYIFSKFHWWDNGSHQAGGSVSKLFVLSDAFISLPVANACTTF